MAGFNRVILMGNLTRDPELKYLPNNTAVCDLGLAVNHKWRDREGNQREEVCFVDLSVFGRQAETMNQYMSKGRPILIEGRLRYDTWTGQDGQKRSKHSVIVDNFKFVGSRESGGQSQGGGYSRGPGGHDQSGPGGPAPAGPGGDAGVADAAPPDVAPPSGSDIPF